LIQVVTHIKTEIDLVEFMTTEMQKRETISLPQWRLYVVRGYQNNKRDMIIVKVHHSMCDGQGMVGFLQRIVDQEVDFTPPNYRSPRIIDYLRIYLALPINFMLVTWLFNMYKGDRNPIANSKKCSGLKIGSFAKDYSLS
jgi:hypothetical protein